MIACYVNLTDGLSTDHLRIIHTKKAENRKIQTLWQTLVYLLLKDIEEFQQGQNNSQNQNIIGYFGSTGNFAGIVR